MIDTQDNHTALMLATKHGHVETVEALLSSKLPPETINATAGFVRFQ